MCITHFTGVPLCALACFATATQAQVNPADQAIIVTGKNVTEAGTRSDINQRPGGTDIVTAAEYANVAAVSLRDALAFSPGVYAQPRFGQEIRLSIRGSGISRGYHMRGLTLLQDSVPINLADDNGDFQELDPQILEHIEIYRGANTLRFGGSTLGGAINGVTPTGRAEPGLEARIDGGSFNTLRGKIAFGFADEIGDAWAALASDVSNGDREHSQRQSLRFHTNIGLRLAENIQTRFYASAQSIDQQLPGALDLTTALHAPRTGNSIGNQQRDIDSIRFQSRTDIALGSVNLEIGGFINGKKLYHPIFQVVDQQSTDWGTLVRLDLVHGPFSLTTGSTARFGTVQSRRYINVNGHRGVRTFDADQRAQTIDLYGEARYQTGALSLIAGGIYTHGEREQNQYVPIPANGQAHFDQFSPRFGLLWQPRTNLQIYANYSRSHEMPGFIELAQIASFAPLDPQRAWTAEIGTRGQIGIVHFDVSAYRAKVEGELLQFSINPDIPASTFNANTTLHQGIEAGLEFNLAPWVRVRQIYQYNDFRFLKDAQYDDNRLPVVPKYLYRAEFRIGTNALNITPVVEWVPQGAWADYANSLRTPGYSTIGVSAEAQLSKQVTLFIDARNLGDSHAIGDISAVIVANPASIIFYPIECRAVYGGIRARL